MDGTSSYGLEPGARKPRTVFFFLLEHGRGGRTSGRSHTRLPAAPHPAGAPQLGAGTGRVCGLQLSARAPEPPRPRRLPQRSPPMVPAGPRRHRPPVGSASLGARRCPAAQHTAGSGWTAPLWVDGVPVDIGQMRACLGPPAPSAQGSLWQQLRDPALPPRASFLDWAVSTRIAVGWSQRLRPPLPGQGLCSLTREGSPNSGQGPEACWTTL